MKRRFETLAVTAVLGSLIVASLVGCEKATNSSARTTPTTTVGTDIDDSVVTSSVKAVLLADPDVKSFDLKVETRKGEVLLSGFVDNQFQMDRATAVTQTVSGVTSIQNKLILKGAPTTVGDKVDAGIMTGKVKAALLNDPNIKSFDIAVVTRKDEVLLSGYVDNQVQMDRAVEIARGIEGVRLVSNEMSIKK